MSTLVIEARTRFSATGRIAAATSSASQTNTTITGHSASIAAFTRRWPTSIVSPPSFRVTRGGWIMPTALIEASNCSSVAGGTGAVRRLFKLAWRARGSTLRSSAMVGSLR
jgi:hypothetical protein